MKVTMFMAISINGYVAGENDDTDWVKDTQVLYDLVAKTGVCIMGRRTYDDCMKYNVFPYKNAINIVVTHDQKLIDQSTDQIIFTNNNLTEIVNKMEGKGFNNIIVMGGGKLNSQFLAAELIDEIIIDIHPIIIDKGIKLFEGVFPRVNLELTASQKLKDGMVQNKYKVLK